MNTKTGLIIVILIALSCSPAAARDNSCTDSIKINRIITAQTRNINMIRMERTKLNSSKYKLFKIIGLKNLKASKTLLLKTKESIINQVNTNNNKAARVAGLYRSIKNNTFALRKDLQLIGKSIEKLIEKWKRENQLKNKRGCLIQLLSQIKKVDRKLTRVQFTSFPHKNLPFLDLARYHSGDSNGGSYKADEAKLLRKRWEMMESIADSDIDEAKNNYEEAKEQFKLAMRIIAEHAERMTQVIQKITS